MKNWKKVFKFLFAIVGVLTFFKGIEISTASCILFGLVIADITISSKYQISYISIISGLALLQWLVMPVIYFSDLNPGMVFEVSIMQVSEEEYFAFAFPGTYFLILGLLILDTNKFDLSNTISFLRKDLPIQYCYNMILLGLFANVFLSFAPKTIELVVNFFTYFSYVGLFGLIIRSNKPLMAKIIILISVGLIVSLAFINGMFGNLVFTFLLFFLLLFAIYRTSLKTKIIIGSIAVSSVLVIQMIKPALRMYKWEDNLSTIESLRRVNQDGLISINTLKSEFFVSYSISRFNQGSIISYVMARFPQKVEYKNGSTVSASIVGSFIPRILWPSKELLGTKMYEEFTGLSADAASFGISALGESYANYGPKKGAYFMIIYGLGFGLLFRYALITAKRNPKFLLFFPILFLHAVKVETEIGRSMGFLIRFFVFLVVINLMVSLLSGKKITLY